MEKLNKKQQSIVKNFSHTENYYNGRGQRKGGEYYITLTDEGIKLANEKKIELYRDNQLLETSLADVKRMLNKILG